jgi:hypothetical protein
LTSHPKLTSIGAARRINLVSGGPVIAPWNVQDLPDDWLDVFDGLSNMQEHEARQKAIERGFEQFRKKNQYRSYLN